MGKKVTFFIGLAIAFASGVKAAAGDDAAAHNSSEMNARLGVASDSGGGDVRVLFIGNSITLHAPAPKIGWTNYWGMAASAAEKDYVHLVTRSLEARLGKKAHVRVVNLADFERGYRAFNFARLDDYVRFSPQYLIVALGENVGGFKDRGEEIAYRERFKQLLSLFMDGKEKPRAVVRGVFWPNERKDALMQEAARELGIPFAKAASQGKDEFMAKGLFSHTGVAAHPGDKGMQMIANAILGYLLEPSIAPSPPSP